MKSAGQNAQTVWDAPDKIATIETVWQEVDLRTGRRLQAATNLAFEGLGSVLSSVLF